MTGLLHEPVVTTVETPVVEALRKTRELLEQGWCQGEYHQRDRYCLVGAMFAVSCDWETEVRMIEAVSEHLNLDLTEDDCRLEEWNDTPGRTKKQVLQAIDQAIQHST